MDALEDLQVRTATMVDAGQAMLLQLSTLTVAYSFSVLGAILLIIGGFVVAGLVERSIYSGLGRLRGFDETLRKFFSKTARYGLLVLVGVTVLAQFGVQTASIIAALGAVGLAIGLALQGTLQNIAAGIMLLALRPFRVGEFVEAGSVSGTIQEIGLFATELKTGNGLFVLAPNSQLWNTPVTNFSRNPSRSHELSVRVAYDQDAERALAIMRDLVESDERVLRTPAPDAFVAELGETAVRLTVVYWAATADWWRTRLHLTRAVKKALEKDGIAIAPPPREMRWLPAPGEGNEEEAASRPA